MEYLISLLLAYKYVIIVPIAIIEGPMVAMISGVLLRLGVFSFLPLFICLMIGDFVSDAYWYWIGYHGGRKFLARFGKYFSVTEGHLDRLEAFYMKHYGWILFLSKITMGLGFAVAIVAMAGAARVPFKRYMAVNMLSQPIWTGTLMSVGYFLGDFYLRLNKGFEIVSVTAVALMAGLALWGFSRYMRQVIIKRYL
jgi:membrane protein DedA with SNARE-associated domain